MPSAARIFRKWPRKFVFRALAQKTVFLLAGPRSALLSSIFGKTRRINRKIALCRNVVYNVQRKPWVSYSLKQNHRLLFFAFGLQSFQFLIQQMQPGIKGIGKAALLLMHRFFNKAGMFGQFGDKYRP